MSSLTSAASSTPKNTQRLEHYRNAKDLEERSRRLSLIPQRTASVQRSESSRQRGADPVNTATRSFPTGTVVDGLQRSHSTRKFSDLQKQASGIHKRQASVDPVFLKHAPLGGVLPRIPTRGQGRGRDSLPLERDTVQPPKNNITQLPSFGGRRITVSDTQGSNAPGQVLRSEPQIRGNGLHGKTTSVSLRTPRVLPLSQQERGVSRPASIRFDESVSVVVHDKPAFSTMQQVFTPKHVQTQSTRPSSGNGYGEQRGSERLSPEVAELRRELLQLHMLHRDSSAVEEQWQASAKDQYRARFESLASVHDSLISRERDLQVQVNAAALLAWGNSIDGSPNLDHKLRMLSNTLTEAWDLCEPNGEYTCIIEAFEHWYMQASRVLEVQNQPSTPSSSSVSLVEEIGDGWRAEAALLISKIRGHKQALDKLGASVESQSDLYRCLTSLCAMLDNMLDEIQLLQEIEGEMVLQGSTWTRNTLASIAASVTRGMGGAS